MAIKAQKNRAKLHRLRDNVHRAKRAVKFALPGAAERMLAKMLPVNRALGEPPKLICDSAVLPASDIWTSL